MQAPPRAGVIKSKRNAHANAGEVNWKPRGGKAEADDVGNYGSDKDWEAASMNWKLRGGGEAEDVGNYGSDEEMGSGVDELETQGGEPTFSRRRTAKHTR